MNPPITPPPAPVTPRFRSFEEAIRHHVRFTLAKDWSDVSNDDLFHAVSLAIKEIAVERLLETERRYREADAKRLHYLSMEFLVGRTMMQNLVNLGLYEECKKALENLGRSIDAIEVEEADPALGNGGLGRLAACFLDSLASLDFPAIGYGINYEFGLFKQVIHDGWQVEKPDRWLADGIHWQIPRPDKAVDVPIYGQVVHGHDSRGRYTPRWVDTRTILGVPHDMPVIGYGGKTVNFLRLYSAQTSHDFHMAIFNQGDYLKAVEDKITSETVSKVLYPADTVRAGKELRLIQEYFFVACALRDLLRRYMRYHNDFREFAAKVAIQMNDTHPAIAVVELMRLLVDDYRQPWDWAWETTVSVMGYTNHTLLPEALEKWPVPMFERVLPRHLEIIYEINARFLRWVDRRWSGDSSVKTRMSIIEEGSEKQVRMAHLAIVGSHSINGVAELHSRLIRERLVPDFYSLWPERFTNVTNGVTPRRWILQANPGLAALLNEQSGRGWVTDLNDLRTLERFAEDPAWRDRLAKIKRASKERLNRFLHDASRPLDPDSLFDVQVKRIHLYKRQLLNVLRLMHEFWRIVDGGRAPTVKQTAIFAGKAAPGYYQARLVIKLIHNLAHAIDQEPKAREWLRVVFVPDYRVSVAEQIIPAADLSEQISTAGMEASGTGNMKLAMNGALTIGTLDGANIEIHDAVGKDNVYIFGLQAEEVETLRRNRRYDPAALIAQYPWMARVVDGLKTKRFSDDTPGLFDSLHHLLMDPSDPFVHLADLPSYIEAHDRAKIEFTQKDLWFKKSALTISRMGPFSSDRSIRDYARDLWTLNPVR